MDSETNNIPVASAIVSNLILIVDDDPTIVGVLSEALKFKGYTTRTATDSLEAIHIFEEEGEFDVVITDLRMPKLSGTELLEKIKQKDPNCEVIVLTGFGSSDSAIEALQKGAHDYIKKPPNLDELYISVEKAIEKKKLTLQNIQYQMDLESLVEERSAELMKTQKFLHSVLESSTEYFIIATDRDGIITLFNLGAEKLFGYNREQVENKKSILFIPGLNDTDKPIDIQSFQKKSITEQHHTVLNNKEEEVSISLTVSPILNEDNRSVGYIWIGKDITEQLHLQEQLHQHTQNLEKLVANRTGELKEQNAALADALDRLKETQMQLLQAEKMASLGQLSAGVAHEINNPIGFVKSNLTTLKKYLQNISKFFGDLDQVIADQADAALADLEKLKNTTKIEFILDDIKSIIIESLEGANRIESIVQDLRDFSYQDRELLAPYDLNSGLKSTLNIVWNELKNKAEVEVDYGDLPEVNCYRQQINQVIMNLLTNAAQSIEDKGKISISTYRESEFACIKVSDNGIGISKKNISHIYEPFFTTKEVGQGIGLGLSISYRIVENHQGKIEVKSSEGKGTTFTVKLPIDGPTESSSEKASRGTVS